VSYIWDFGDDTYSSAENPKHLYTMPGKYIVTLTVNNIAGESIHRGLVTVYQGPTAIFEIYPTEVINNSQVVVFTNYSHHATSWIWNFGDGSFSSEENPWHKYNSEGKYKVSLEVASKDGCTDSLIYYTPVNVLYRTGEIKFPNVFKWNRSGPTGGYWIDDELNDNVFRPFFKNVIEYKLQIFNRLGMLIYESEELNKGWDGYSVHLNLAHQGVYVYKVVGRFADGTYFTKVGDVTFLH
jgi:PKD repeat protein